MHIDLRSWGPMTVLMVIAAAIILGAGAIAVVTGNYDGDFAQWLDDLTKFALALGALGVGRGLLEGGKKIAAVQANPDAGGLHPEHDAAVNVRPEDEVRDLHDAPGA